METQARQFQVASSYWEEYLSGRWQGCLPAFIEIDMHQRCGYSALRFARIYSHTTGSWNGLELVLWIHRQDILAEKVVFPTLWGPNFDLDLLILLMKPTGLAKHYY